MNIKLPKKLNNQEDIIVDSKIIIVIGSNGSGISYHWKKGHPVQGSEPACSF